VGSLDLPIGGPPQLINFVALKNDITEELRQEERLRQAQEVEAIGTLTFYIANYFNNILYPMVGFAEMLCDDLPGESKTHEYASDTGTASATDTDKE
jgi:hypothetical protein